MNTYGEWRYSSIPDLGRFTPGERAPGTHWIGGWVGPRAGLDAMEKREAVAPARNRTRTVQPVSRRYTDWAIPPYDEEYLSNNHIRQSYHYVEEYYFLGCVADVSEERTAFIFRVEDGGCTFPQNIGNL
jgi:hypothetical protein